MLTREERRMITAITAAAVMLSAASAVSIVKNIVSKPDETNIYFTSPTDTVSQAVQPTQSPVCAPLIVFPETTLSNADAAQTAPTTDVVTVGYIAAIPLSRELQNVMYAACSDYGVPYELALAVCEAESTFKTDADNGTCWGLMQIHPVNYEWLRDIGIEPTTYEGNIQAGVYILGQHLMEYGDTHKALMAYNCGEYGAARLWKDGYTTSNYSRNVVEKSEKWQEVIAESYWR